ncbi:kelch-like protein 25 isoform 1-T1 [Glossina fuscipes fuscipes]
MSNAISNNLVAGSTGEAEQFFAEKCKNPDYSNAFLDSLNKMRINRENCDFALEVGGETIYAHRLVLTIASPYFAALFKNDTKEKATGLVKLEDNDVSAVKTIVEYIYSGELPLTEENVQSICTTSDYLQIEWVKSECLEFLKRNLNATNCLQLRTIAEKSPFEELYECSRNYILANFVILIDKKEWLEQTFEVIEDLIKDDKLLVHREENAYKGVMNWIKYDLTKRQNYLAKLTRHVRLTYVRTEFLRDHILTEIMLTSDPQCNQFLNKAFRYQLTPRAHGPSSAQRNRNGKFLVVFAGGADITTDTAHRNCKVYDSTDNNMSPIPDMLDCRSAHSVISLNGKVYSVGGCCDDTGKTAECYDPVGKKWTHIAPMSAGRYDFGICACDNLMYAIGGCSRSSVESYNAATNTWYTCPDIPFAVNLFCRAAVIRHSIYSLNRRSNGITSCIRFDSREGRWHNLNEMPWRLTNDSFEFMSYDNSLFSIGRNCSRLDIRTNKWEAMPSMLFERFGYSAAIIAEDVYVFGGTGTDRDYINSIERYNIHTNEWTVVDSLETEVYWGGAAVISGDFNLN